MTNKPATLTNRSFMLWGPATTKWTDLPGEISAALSHYRQKYGEPVLVVVNATEAAACKELPELDDVEVIASTNRPANTLLVG